ncbi:P-loop containing nucleoside triphosphate hydrolase protein, partial [Coemansia reversa NRRL 1564]
MHAKAIPLVDEQFQESVSGAITIRAFEAGHFVRQKLMHRMASCAQLQWLCDGVETWTDLNMTVLREFTITVAFAIALFGAYSQSSNLQIDPATLLLVHFSVTMHLGRLQHLIRQTHSLRSSLARAAQYINATLVPQADIMQPTSMNTVDKCWPSCGLIVFNRVFACYNNVSNDKDAHIGSLSPMVLRNVSFTIYPGQHIGIVGRTGSGKTSIAMALLGLLPPTSGQILIDNMDITHVPLATLREKLGIVPQSTYVFPGTVRENLDPWKQYGDNQIRHSLDLVGLNDININTTNVDTWSAGQRQLLGLARAILKQVRILILDEATAFINAETSQHLHMVIRRCFQNCTVITIAHRIQSVLDCHSVLVVSNGTICESGPPSDLAACAGSAFSQM